MDKSLATSRQELWPKVSWELLLKRGCLKASLSPSLLPLPPQARQRMAAGRSSGAGTAVGLVPRIWNNGIAMPGSSVPRQGCFLHSTGEKGTIPIAGSLEQLGQAAAAGHWWPGCSWDTIPPPPPAKWQGWGWQGPSARMQAVQWPHAGRCNCHSIVTAAGQVAPGSEQAACPAVTPPCPRADRPRRLPPRGGLAGLVGVRGKGEEQGRSVPPYPGSHSRPRWGCPRGARAVVPALAADNAVSSLAARYQRGGDGQTPPHPERSVLGSVGKGSRPPSPPASLGPFVFTRLVFFPA